MNLPATKEQRRQLALENLDYPEHLVEVPLGNLGQIRSSIPKRVWRSRRFMVVLWMELSGWQRLTCQRTKLLPNGEWKDGLSWDDLQRLKAEAGFGDHWAVECFPPDSQVVNVANLRHLFLLPAAPDFGWKRS